MTDIYVAWYSIAGLGDKIYNKHLYLVKDDDGLITTGNTSHEWTLERALSME